MKPFRFNPLVPELIVSDFARSIRFYTDVIGHRIVYQRENPSFAYLEFEGAQIMIEARQDDSWVNGELTPPFGRGIHLQIACVDVGALRERLRANSVDVFLDVHDGRYQAGGRHIVQRQFLVSDPDGYLLRFCQLLSDSDCSL